MDSTDNDDDDDGDDDDDIPLLQLVNEHRMNVDLTTIATFDDHLPIEDTSDDWENELLNEFRKSEECDKSPSDDESESCSDENLQPNGCEMSHNDALVMIKKLRNFALAKDERYLEHILKIESMSMKIVLKSKSEAKQQTVDSFFKR
ncbi:serine/threonine-protein kinase rio2-like isoform X1 [Gigantopelta aegis]|uniref:serine/threonine-protein kinase rio2-like isoform X1 n=1 Tax=Gigantopelta aegis TaxID=1735272 RepID=UPI001B88A0C6|nr:serine/threonine-protein kinase rio2-like isoform X1 [Gigantopelta aegis]